MANGFFARMARKWWLMLVIGLIIGLAAGLPLGGELAGNAGIAGKLPAGHLSGSVSGKCTDHHFP